MLRYVKSASNFGFTITIYKIGDPLFHGRTRTAYLYRCVWSGITGR